MASLRMWAAVFVAALFVSGSAFAQSVTQAGPAVGGQLPVYLSGGGGGSATVMAAGKAAGGPIGTGVNEFLQQSQNPVGSGPYGAHNCTYSTYATNSGGANYFCFDANANGGGLLAFGALGGAAPVPASLWINGTQYPMPGTVAGLPSVASNIELKLEPISFAPLVERQDYSYGFGAPPVTYTPQSAACSLNNGAGDGGSQVPAAGSGCWIMSPQVAYDPREWGNSNAVTWVGSSFGPATDTNNLCFSQSNPCATTQHAANVLTTTNWLGQSSYVEVGSGNIAGAMVSGNPFGAMGNGISGQYMIFNGRGITLTHLTASAGQIFSLEASSGAKIEAENIDFLNTYSGGYPVFVQNPGSILEIPPSAPVSVTCTVPAAVGLHVEAHALIEIAAHASLTFQGNCGNPLNAAQFGYLEFDPNGLGGTISCGTGVLDSEFVELVDNSVMQLGNNWSFVNCGGSQGGTDLALISRDSVLDNFGTAQIPGVGSFKITNGSYYYPQYVPTLGTCANAAFNGGDTNYSMRINFTGANTTCAVNFGTPAAPAVSYFHTTPNCAPTVSTLTPGKTATVQSLSPSGFTLVPSAAFASGDVAIIACQATQNG